MIPLKTQAVQTALQGDWQAAVILNQMLLEEDPTDIDALNRLAFAKISLGEIKEAKSIYQKVLTLDENNPIALKNLQRLNDTSPQTNGNLMQHFKVSNVFIEEPGKTKVTDLINTADRKLLTQIRNGEQLTLTIKRMKIFAYDSQKQYIGMLPHDIGNRLIKFIEGGNHYEAYVKIIENTNVTVLLKEVKKAAKFKNQPSFISIDKTKLSLMSEMKKNVKDASRENDSHGSSSDEDSSE